MCECSLLQLIRSCLIQLSSVLVYNKQTTSGLTAFCTAAFSKRLLAALLLVCQSLCLSLIPLSWSHLAQTLSTQPQRLPQSLMGLSSISATCWNRKLAKHWKYVVENLHQSLKFKCCQLLAGVTGRAQSRRVNLLLWRNNFLHKHRTRCWKKPLSPDRSE